LANKGDVELERQQQFEKDNCNDCSQQRREKAGTRTKRIKIMGIDKQRRMTT